MCRGRFTLIARARVMKHGLGRTKALRCASAGFRIRADHIVNRHVRLGAGCLRQLRLARHHRLVVMYTSRAATGQLGQRRRGSAGGSGLRAKGASAPRLTPTSFQPPPGPHLSPAAARR